MLAYLLPARKTAASAISAGVPKRASGMAFRAVVWEGVGMAGRRGVSVGVRWWSEGLDVIEADRERTKNGMVARWCWYGFVGES